MTHGNQKIATVQAFLDGLTANSVETMPLADDVVLITPLDRDHPLRGKQAAAEFLRSRVFPKIPVRRVEVERHMIDGDHVATLWTATFAVQGREIDIPI